MRRTFLLVGAVLLLAACSSGGPTAASSTSRSPTVSPSSSETPGTTSRSPTARVTYGPTALVSGHESCGMADDLHATWTADGRHARNGWFTCTVTNVDPRVAGTSRYTWNANRWGQSADSGSMVQWGTARIKNSGGSWESRYTGIYTSQTGDIVTHVFIGKGGYAGLSYYMWAYETFGPTWPTQGLIFPGTLPSS